MHCLKIVCWYSTVRPSGNQRSVKYGTEIIPSNMVRFLKRTLRSVIVRVELNWHSSLLMVTCPASRAFFAAWLLAFPKSFRGDEWSIKIFNSSQNFIFARLDDLLAKFKPVLACSCSQNSCSCSHVFVRIRKQRSQEEQPYRTLLYRHECFTGNLDCKTVRIFAYSSSREQSNKRSGAKLRLARDSYATLYRFLYWFPSIILSMSFCLDNKKNSTWRLEDMNLFSRCKPIFYERAQRVSKILFCHSKIKFISSRHHVISSLYKARLANLLCIVVICRVHFHWTWYPYL